MKYKLNKLVVIGGLAWFFGAVQAATLVAQCGDGYIRATSGGIPQWEVNNKQVNVYTGSQSLAHIASCGTEHKGVVAVFDQGGVSVFTNIEPLRFHRKGATWFSP